eukprot:2457908-Amphidinium_carterae.1
MSLHCMCHSCLTQLACNWFRYNSDSAALLPAVAAFVPQASAVCHPAQAVVHGDWSGHACLATMVD